MKVYKKILVSSLVFVLVLSVSNRENYKESISAVVPAHQIPLDQKTVALIKSMNDTIDIEVHKSKNRKEIECLAKNIFYEARNQPVMGKVSIAFVPITRSKESSHSICRVVYQKNNRGCQFTWVCTVKKQKGNAIEQKAKKEALIIAYLAYNNMISDPTEGANFYYNPKLAHPKWAKTMAIIKTMYANNGYIGDHLFLKNY